MKRYLRLLVAFLLAVQAFAATDPQLVETKVQSDLDSALSRLIPREQYLLQVNSTVDTIQEKKVVEGETTMQTPETSNVVVPPLPGFQPDPAPARATPPQQSRQTYRVVETPILKQVSVHVALDEKLPQETITQAQSLVTSYLSANYGAKAAVRFERIKMLPPKGGERNREEGSFPPWIAVALALIGVLGGAFFFRWLRWRGLSAPSVPYRPVYASETTDVTPPKELPGAKSTLPSTPAKPLALPSGTTQGRGAFPALPATMEFVDQRSKLLELFLKQSEIFRLYFARLAEAAQTELYAGLRGPAFDSLLEGLGLSIPPGGESTTPPSEEQMLFYEKNFLEFLQANEWQNSQFFGFLHQLTDEQLLALARHESPLVASLMLKFMKPNQSAAVLQALTSKERVEILSQSALMHRLSSSELLSIEEAVRARVAKLPKFLMGSTREDLEFWTRVLSQTEDQEAILLDLEQTRPELYPSLAKFRFRLEDAPSLPKPLLEKVLGEVDNEELALAMVTCPRDVSRFLLDELSPKRRELLANQLAMLQGMPSDKTSTARMALTRRFREVMA